MSDRHSGDDAAVSNAARLRKTAVKPRPASAPTKSRAKAVKPAPTRAELAKRAPLKRPRYTRAETEAIYERLAAVLPNPQTELSYHSPYTLLVAVVLSAQATDAGVNKATAKLYAAADTPEAMVALGEAGVREHIKSLGLFNMKAKNVVKLSQILVDEYGGEVPADRDVLQSLPGVGRKTASVVLNEAFGQPTIAVDTHIFRVANRLGLAPGKTPDDVERMLEKVTPERFKRGAHHWLILHGRHVCKARRPLCDVCQINALCKSPERIKADPGLSEGVPGG